MKLETPIDGLPGATIFRVDALPQTLEGSVQVGPYSCARPGMLLRVVPGTGRFLARDGIAIDVAPEHTASAAALDAIIHGGVLGALMHQREELPLHATTLVAPDRRHAVAIAGPSGAGKSTTAYELIRRGWILLSDDLARVTIEGGHAIAWPGRSTVRLMGDACRAFGLDSTALVPAPAWDDKYVAKVERWNEPLPLSALVSLERDERPLTLTRFGNVAAMRLATEQTYRLHYVAALGKSASHLRLVAGVVNSTRIAQLQGKGGVADVADLIELQLGASEK